MAKIWLVGECVLGAAAKNLDTAKDNHQANQGKSEPLGPHFYYSNYHRIISVTGFSYRVACLYFKVVLTDPSSKLGVTTKPL
jgi:hypothetical protein